ncbi:hypothetical protein EHF33_07400 [Deinococcus psychrotolerans]|uniref:Uncharacterized protein n=1 Tax=Deinococcus psychrotolerans TaxID=2489213 RepID=A0A3G8YLT8_9DEIO|nr:hypothetical protein [Deinococcus psychrotolerans]AZI42591.1 hypothetical protein EHF33_07400 [Deinococcus psychrotolerans]
MKLNPVVAAILTPPLLLVACNGGNAPSTAPYTVSGTLYNFNASASTPSQVYSAWSGGSGSMEALNGSINLATGSVASNGNFAVTLPATIADTNLNAFNEASLDLSYENCTGALNISNKAALTTAIEFGVKGTNNNGLAGAVDLSVTKNSSGGGQVVTTGSALVYSDAATNLSGKQTCISNGTSVISNFDIKLKAGYNVLNLVVTINVDAAGKGSGSLNYANGTRASHWIVNPGLATPLSLNNNVQTLTNTLKQQAKTLFH